MVRIYLTLCALGTVSLLALIFGPTLVNIATVCWRDDDYSHGLILPFAALYILWTKKEILQRRWQANRDTPQSRLDLLSGVLGGLLLLGGLFFVVMLRAGGLETGFGDWFAFFPTITGIALLALRWNIAVIVVPQLLLNYMAKPIPDTLVPKLFNPFQTFAASVSAKVLNLLDVPVYTIGNVIEIPGMKLLVEEACSGMRSLMALMTVAVIVLSLISFPWWIRFGVFLLAIGLAIILNIFRVAATGVLAYFYDKDSATGFFHTFSGMVVFIVGLVILYSVANLLADRFGKEER